jgi:hypothetical protein
MRKDNESGQILLEWIVGISCLLLVVIAYAVITPSFDKLINALVISGSPISPTMFIKQCYVWAFIIMGIACIVYPFIAGYRKEYEQQVI